MARETIIQDDSSDDEFPDLYTALPRKSTSRVQRANSSQTSLTPKPATTSTSTTTVRRRKLGLTPSNTLMQPWTAERAKSKPPKDEGTVKRPQESQGPRVTLRARKAQPVVQIMPKDEDDESEFLSAKEEITFVEEASVHEHDEEEEASAFEVSGGSDFEGDSDDSDNDLFFDSVPSRSQRVPSGRQPSKPSSAKERESHEREVSRSRQRPQDEIKAPTRSRKSKDSDGRFPGDKPLSEDLSGKFLRLDLNLSIPILPRPGSPSQTKARATTPPSTPPKARPKGLTSPKKIPRIPTTPHHPTSDMFWSQEFVDDWNDRHSPKKILFPQPDMGTAKSASPKKSTSNLTTAAKNVKKAFAKEKHALAASFLKELDDVITDGELSRLAAATGGIQINWSNKLNTTAGRANWKRETVRTRGVGDDPAATTTTYRHHAAIELAEKVIDDEDRLLNVVAHEFCHLANFMVNGITTNPHGKEFKAWATRCSRAFGSRGIQVTTKHSYDIDFKYVWECSECGTAFKRHSKSIHPERHRCGSCKGPLVQTKPVPRAVGKTSEYQRFMKEQMRVLKEENPGSPQKDIMKLVADRWTRKQGKEDDVVSNLKALTLESEA